MEQKIERLMSLVQKCYESFIVAQNDSTLRPYLIKDTLPILYFGDIEAYFKSQYKIITAAINPSCSEFYYDESNEQISYKRFPQFERIAKANALNNDNILQYLSALNSYFKTGNDYKKWFKTPERDNLFVPFGASYYDNAPNRAIHTDTLSPFATFPTWSKFTPQSQRERIQRRFSDIGIPLWNELVEILEPDIIFMSLNKKYISHIDFYKTFRDYITYPDKKYRGREPLKIQYGYINLNGKTTHIFNESITFRKPFLATGKKYTIPLGKQIFERFTNGTLQHSDS